MGDEDDRSRPVAVAEAPVAPVFSTTTSVLAARMAQTVMPEGEVAAPSTIELEEQPTPQFAATLRVSEKRRRRRRAVAIAVVAAWVAVLVAALASNAMLSGGGVSWAMSFVAPLLVWLWSRRIQHLWLDRESFSLRAQPAFGSGWQSVQTRLIFGFGYQRVAPRRDRWQLVVVLHTGVTMPLDLIVSDRAEVRFIARRLNAALADVQRANA